jgi:hypothetical protein
MTEEPLDEQYFRWLYDQVGSIKRTTHWQLLRQLHSKEFVWIIPNDDNRLEDGRDLRLEFIQDHYHHEDSIDPMWMDLGCSMLEMLIALSRRLEFEDDTPAKEWFWQMMENLDLSECTDASGYSEQEVDEILDDVIWRLYKPNGHGGLFPLEHAEEDQRDIEIWYQFSAYLQEIGG